MLPLALRANREVQLHLGAHVRSFVSLAGIQRLLLHGETNPYDSSSSQSNQRFLFVCGGSCFKPFIRAEALRWRGGIHSLWPDSKPAGILPAMPRSSNLSAGIVYHTAPLLVHY